MTLIKGRREAQAESWRRGGRRAAVGLAIALVAWLPVARAEEAHSTREPARASGITTDGSSLAKSAADAIRGDSSLVAPESLKLRINASGRDISLSGSAATIYDREQAARQAEGIEGVRYVHPSIAIQAKSMEPSSLEQEVEKAVQDAGVKGASFAARAKADGTVHLNGEVTDEWAAIDAVKRVVGVTAIGGYEARVPGQTPPAAEGELSVVAPSAEQDEAVARRVREALAAADLSQVSVEVNQGVVKLLGQLPSAGAALVASRATAAVPGVRGIQNRIGIPARLFYVGEEPPSADVIEKGVQRALRSRRLGSRIERLSVHVSGGSVLLSGRAKTEDDAHAALDAAAGVAGVQEVINALSYPVRPLGT